MEITQCAGFYSPGAVFLEHRQKIISLPGLRRSSLGNIGAVTNINSQATAMPDILVSWRGRSCCVCSKSPMTSDPSASEQINAILIEFRALRGSVRAKLGDHSRMLESHSRKFDGHSRITDTRLDEVRAKTNSLEASVRVKMDSLEASVRTAQAEITDISECMNDVQDLNSDSIRRSNIEQEARHPTPKANEFVQPELSIGAAVMSVEVDFAYDDVQETPSAGDKSRNEENVGHSSKPSAGILGKPDERRKE